MAKVLPDGSTTLTFSTKEVEEIDTSKGISLPGWDASYKPEELRCLLAEYQHVGEDKLWEHLSYFLKAIVPVAEESAFSYATDLARGVLGWAHAACGRPEEGVVLIRRGLVGQTAAGAMVGVTDVLTRLAEAQWLGGGAPAALDTIERALTINPQERIFRPNALVVRGGLRQELGEAALAQADYAAGVDMAMDMGALAWALTAALAYARLTSALGDEKAAHSCLARVCGAFPDGCDATEFPEANEWLARLGG